MFFAGILKVNDENSRIRIQDPDPNPDPLVRGMDPRIRIRIHPKMSWIRNTAFFYEGSTTFIRATSRNKLLSSPSNSWRIFHTILTIIGINAAGIVVTYCPRVGGGREASQK